MVLRMQIKDQVCALEYSKRLDELGVKSESLFIWKEIAYKKSLDGQVIETRIVLDHDGTPWVEFKDRWWRAYTVAELGELLPKGGWHQESTSGGTRVWAVDPKFPHGDIAYTWDKSEANARAKMGIHLIENGLMEIEK